MVEMFEEMWIAKVTVMENLIVVYFKEGHWPIMSFNTFELLDKEISNMGGRFTNFDFHI